MHKNGCLTKYLTAYGSLFNCLFFVCFLFIFSFFGGGGAKRKSRLASRLELKPLTFSVNVRSSSDWAQGLAPDKYGITWISKLSHALHVWKSSCRHNLPLCAYIWQCFGFRTRPSLTNGMQIVAQDYDISSRANNICGLSRFPAAVQTTTVYHIWTDEKVSINGITLLPQCVADLVFIKRAPRVCACVWACVWAWQSGVSDNGGREREMLWMRFCSYCFYSRPSSLTYKQKTHTSFQYHSFAVSRLYKMLTPHRPTYVSARQKCQGFVDRMLDTVKRSENYHKK